jgi:CheY-like chemotaxis protein
VASTLLAVDDSVTMRKVLEITFAGTDLKVVTANTPDAALQQLKAAKPDLVISDITLEGKTGYELCKTIKQQAPGTIVLLLSSKQNPYDAAKGSEARADDHMDKPFDTQQMIDKVKKMLTSKGDIAAAPAPAPAPAVAQAAPAQASAPTAVASRTVGAAAVPAAQAAPPAAAGGPPQAAQRAKTLIYGPGAGVPMPGGAAAPPAAAAKPAFGAAPSRSSESSPNNPPTPVTGLPLQSQRSATAQSPVAPGVAALSPASGSAGAHVNGQMASKLEGLGLTPTQVDAVMALSREVVERVVWEVVPVLAETIIKEEIARLTK